MIGKTIGGGIPAAAYGFTEAVAERVSASIEREDCDVGGIGGTLAGNALSPRPPRDPGRGPHGQGVRAMIPLGERFEAGVNGVCAARRPVACHAAGGAGGVPLHAGAAAQRPGCTTRWTPSWSGSSTSGR